ncbi:YczE/YyaS/YitT family protein [Peptacetobacter sp.]|uniref:YczE/YyaS/YitT family protein n=2 Tax=Peptacetobacter sp. TaxID=2991975 RepID=UPI00261F09BA|nr:hypothetical protein [Peptacetobacter sp.]
MDGVCTMFKTIISKLVKLVGGLFICSVGIVMTINANLGMQPWDVLHRGISDKLGITIGTATIIIASLTMIADFILGDNIGWGTVANMVLVGLFMDMIIYSGLIPEANTILSGLLLLIFGLLILSFGMVFYMDSGLGSGPRDGLMVCLQKKTGKSANIVKVSMDITALVIGILLGGKVGIGTIISAFGLGLAIKIVFKICKFDATEVENRYIVDDIKYVKNLSNNMTK